VHAVERQSGREAEPHDVGFVKMKLGLASSFGCDR
jgi:hypothetical protein